MKKFYAGVALLLCIIAADWQLRSDASEILSRIHANAIVRW